MAQTLDVDYMLLKQEKGGYRLGTSKREELFELFTDRKPEEIVLKLILYDETFYNRRILGSSNGSANQEFKVKDEKNLCYDDFELMVANNDKWKVWKKTETLDNSFNNEENYVLNTQNAAVRFGDNINGKAPTPGENSIIITSASTTLGQNGSIKAFAISGNCDAEDFSDIEIFQFRNSIGGRSAETPQELILKAQQSINTVSRAVGVSDYKRLAMQTPGLKLSQVTVVPLYKPGLVGYPEIKAENCITLVIEPYNGNIEKTAVQGYIKNVQNYMEQYRLLTTRIFVTAPVYVPIDVYAEIWVSANTPELSKKIRADIEHYINKMQAERLGATLYNGDIANTLETIDEVKLLKYFYMEISEDTAIKNRFGDIILLPPTRAYLRQCSITFNV